MYGKRVMGAEGAARARAARHVRTTGYGKRVTGQSRQEVIAAAGAEAAEREAAERAKANGESTGGESTGGESTSIPSPATLALLEQELATSPQLAVPLTVAELQREKGPRKGALLLLRAVGEESENHALVAEIDAVLAEIQRLADAKDAAQDATE